jgi:chemotaxis signal transduction protein
VTAASVVFRVQRRDYALPIELVREVIRVGEITPVPHAARGARGLTCVRGRLLPVIDAAVLLGHPPAAIDTESRLVIVAAGGPRMIAILVDRVGGLRDAAAVDALDVTQLIGGAA